MQLYASRNIYFLYMITFLDLLLGGLQELPTLQIISLEIGIKCIISDYNKGNIIRELRIWDHRLSNSHVYVYIYFKRR
jgi:hypothetical protein